MTDPTSDPDRRQVLDDIRQLLGAIDALAPDTAAGMALREQVNALKPDDIPISASGATGGLIGISTSLLPSPQLTIIGRIESSLQSAAAAPKQGHEGAPDAWITLDPRFAAGLRDLQPGDAIVVLTWFDRADRTILEVHPRDDIQQPTTGVFRTRSADRPNPIGLHPVTIRQIDGHRLLVGPIEAIDSTPVLDLKPVI